MQAHFAASITSTNDENLRRIFRSLEETGASDVVPIPMIGFGWAFGNGWSGIRIRVGGDRLLRLPEGPAMERDLPGGASAERAAEPAPARPAGRRR